MSSTTEDHYENPQKPDQVEMVESMDVFQEDPNNEHNANVVSRQDTNMAFMQSSASLMPNSGHQSGMEQWQPAKDQWASQPANHQWANQPANGPGVIQTANSQWTSQTEKVTQNIGVQLCSPPETRRSAVTATSNFNLTGLMNILTILSPIISSNLALWRSSRRNIMNKAESMFFQVAYIYYKVHAYIRTMPTDQIARDIFRVAMDVILVIYAIGFILLSMYQAAIFA